MSKNSKVLMSMLLANYLSMVGTLESHKIYFTPISMKGAGSICKHKPKNRKERLRDKRRNK